MLKEVHEHILSELQQSSKTDTVFVVAAVLFNLVVLGINWGVAQPHFTGKDQPPVHRPQDDVILIILIASTILINFFITRALLVGRDTRTKLLEGMVAMYRDNNVEKYYDPGLLGAYGSRYRLFVAVIIILAGIAIFVPLLNRFLS